MNRREILEMVCNFRKERDFYRKREKAREAMCNDGYYHGMGANVVLGMRLVVQEYAVKADICHEAAHFCMDLLR